MKIPNKILLCKYYDAMMLETVVDIAGIVVTIISIIITVITAILQETIDIKKTTSHFRPRCVVAF